MVLDQKELKRYESLLIQKKLRGLDDLYYYNKYIIESDPARRKFLVDHVHGEWSTWFKNAKSRVRIILVPRGHFKTSFFTIGWALQQIAKNRNTRGLIANATLANSQRMLGEIKYHLQNNEIFKSLYGEMYDPKLKWNEDEIIVKGRSKGVREATITAVGVGGNLVSQHYDWIIGDDLVNNENSDNKFQADKVIDWWNKSFSLLEPEGIMLIIGTRWNYYELYSHLIEEYKDKFDFFIRSSYKEGGGFYFPERFNEEKLKELKTLHGSFIFSSFYLNSPIDEERALIKESQVKYYKKCPEVVNTFSMCDPAISQSERADFSTILTASIDSFNTWYVREIRRGKWTVGQLIEELFSVHKRWKPLTMSLEVIGQAQTLLAPIHEAEEEKGIYLPLTPIKARIRRRKEHRIRAVLQPRFEQGKIFIKKEMGEKPIDLKDELISFPNAKHDDMIECLSDLEKIGYAPNEKKEEEESGGYFESQLKENFNRQSDNADPVMGEFY